VTRAAAPSRRVRLGILLAVPAGMLLVAVAAPSPAPARESPAAAIIEPAGKARVRSVLDGMRGNPVENAQPSLPIADDRERDSYRQPLAEFLASPRDPLLRQAVLLAVQQQQVELVPQLRALLAHAAESDRQLLVEAIDQLQPWSGEELADLVRSTSPGAAVGALRIAGLRDRPPLDAIVERLVDPVADVRAAASAALPAELSAAAGEQILAALRGVAGDRCGEALAALARCAAGGDVDDMVYAQIERQTEHCDAVLGALANCGAPLARPDAVRRLALDESAPLHTRGRALRCLEATGAVDGAAAFEQMRVRHPALLYAAARLLLTARRPAGVELLFEVLRDGDEPADERAEGGDARLVLEAQLGARQILAELADTSANAEVAEWQEWWHRRPELQFERLPAPTVVFGR
jgi:hypothetical protein